MAGKQITAFHRALRLIDPYIPETALGTSAGSKIEALHSLVKKNHISQDSLKRLREVIHRYQKSISASDFWYKVGLTFVHAAVTSMTTRETVELQKQHRTPVCILARFSDHSLRHEGVRFRNPKLTRLQIQNSKANFRLVSDRSEFLYSIYGMNNSAVEAFFQKIESIAWAPDNYNNRIYRQASLLILQHVRNFTVTSPEAGKFKFVFDELEKTINSIDHTKPAIIHTDERFIVTQKFMQRRVQLANGNAMIVAPLTRNSALVLHDELDSEELSRGVEIARVASYKIPLLRGEPIYGFSFQEVFSV